ncbi:MAG: anti-sigma factor antagonist [Streptosporangiaceae bacterium]|jgi:anti-sigma B factor antagonist|nr:anti-anti-sigma regulatory factor [Streptosporangiaceae bacterium]MDX6431726.1 anti-sigma factor antagonist [Streptosporangiaceae bacterium]
MAGLWVSTRVAEPYAVVTVGGELDVASAGSLREHLVKVLRRLGPRLALDLGELSFMDSSGLSVLISCWKLARGMGGTLCVVAPPDLVKLKLRITGLDRRVEVFPDLRAMFRAAGADG